MAKQVARKVVESAAGGAEQFRDQRDLPGDAIGDADRRQSIRHQQRQSEAPEDARPVPGEAPPHLHQFTIDVAQAFGDVDQAERDQDRDLDEDHAEMTGIEPDRRENGPADRRKRVEHWLDPLIDHAVEPWHAIGEKREPAADQQRRRDRDQNPPCRGRDMPEEFRRHEQFEQPPCHRYRTGQDEFRQAAAQHEPGEQHGEHKALPEQPPGESLWHGCPLSPHSAAIRSPAADRGCSGPCSARRR